MRYAAALILAGLLTAAPAGCGTSALLGRESVRLELMPPLDEQLYKNRIFFAEYLRETGATTERVAVLAEDLTDPLHLVLNPARFVSGETGAERLPVLAKRLAPLRLFAVLGADGRRLGYAFLPPGRTLRPSRFARGIHTFDLIAE